MSTDIAPKAKTATIYRMVMPGHTRPYGIKTLDLLERQLFGVDDVREFGRSGSCPSPRTSPWSPWPSGGEHST